MFLHTVVLLLNLISNELNCRAETANILGGSSLFPLSATEGNDKDDENSSEDDIIVIPNNFPKDINFFCNPRNDLMRDRLCFGQLDAFSLACVDDTPPLQLVPFCLVFKNQCSQINYPNDDWCAREFHRYAGFCSRAKRKCKSCTHDFSCYCEPYDCLWKRYGYETAMWCQRYELFCNEKERRRKGTDLVSLMHDTVRVHYRCMHMFNLAKVICNPLRIQFDQQRCIKFLFDCELITEWDEEQTERKGSTFIGGNNFEKQEKSKTLTPSSEDIKLANKLAEEERLLEKLVKEREKEEKKNSTKSEVASLVTEHGVTDIYHIKSSTVLNSQMTDKNQQHTTAHPFSKIMLTKMNDT